MMGKGLVVLALVVLGGTLSALLLSITERRRLKELSESDLEFVEMPDEIPERITRFWEVSPIGADRALRTPDGRITLVFGRSWEEEMIDVDEKITGRVSATIAFAGGFPESWRVHVPLREGYARDELIRATLRETESPARASIHRGWLICTQSGGGGGGTIGLARTDQLLVTRLDEFHRRSDQEHSQGDEG